MTKDPASKQPANTRCPTRALLVAPPGRQIASATRLATGNAHRSRIGATTQCGPTGEGEGHTETYTAPLAGYSVVSKTAQRYATPNTFDQQYGVRHRKVTYRVKTGRYTHAMKGYRAWRGGRADRPGWSQQWFDSTAGDMDEIEQWLPTAGYERWYEVSSLGRLRRRMASQGTAPGYISRGCYKRRTGYMTVQLYLGGRRKSCNLHRLIAETFHGSPAAGMEVRHLDGNPLNNAASNLRWGTKKENAADRQRHKQLRIA